MDMYRTKRVPDEKWRETLKVGDRVDVRIPLNEDEQQIEEDTFMGWIQARIYDIENVEEDKEDPQNGRLLNLECPELPQTRDMIMDRWSTNIAKVGTHTQAEYEWKRELYNSFSE